LGLNALINTLGILGIDDARTSEDESEQDDYGISASYIRDLLGGTLDLGAGFSPTTGTNYNAGYSTDLFGGTLGLGAGYSPTTGTNFALSFLNPLIKEGRVGFADGPKNPGKRKTMKIFSWTCIITYSWKIF
jgi:hypothetical protein